MENKIYYPETIESQLLPGTESEESTSSEVSSSKTNLTPTRSPVNVQFPIKSVAVETMSSSFNTKTKKILGNYTFGVLGAISIGEYVNGVSGEVKISPDGIIAKNVNGDTTFALDATTGDATFKGTILAGALVAGAVAVTGSFIVNIDGYDSIILGNLDGGLL